MLWFLKEGQLEILRLLKPWAQNLFFFYIQGIQAKAQPGPQNYPFQRYSVVIEDIVLVLHFNVLILCALFSAFSD